MLILPWWQIGKVVSRKYESQKNVKVGIGMILSNYQLLFFQPSLHILRHLKLEEIILILNLNEEFR